MHTLNAISFIALAALSGIASAAPDQVPASDSSVQITASTQRGQAADMDFERISGQYTLANGDILTMSRRHKDYYAQVEGGRKIKLVATGEKSFAALDGRTDLRFDVERGGARIDVVMNMPAK